jgi:hypothetical protein
VKSDLSPVPFPNGKGCLLDEKRYIVVYLDSIQVRLASHKEMISLRELQSQTGEELDALMPSVLDRRRVFDERNSRNL